MWVLCLVLIEVLSMQIWGLWWEGPVKVWEIRVVEIEGGSDIIVVKRACEVGCLL